MAKSIATEREAVKILDEIESKIFEVSASLRADTSAIHMKGQLRSAQLILDEVRRRLEQRTEEI